jgi:hypothetical protein
MRCDRHAVCQPVPDGYASAVSTIGHRASHADFLFFPLRDTLPHPKPPPKGGPPAGGLAGAILGTFVVLA